MNRANGINVTKKRIKLLVNNLDSKPERIFSSAWPAVKLANSRTPKENALAIYEINSIRTNKGTKAKGVPPGTKKEKNLILWIYKPKIVTPIKIVRLSPRLTTADVAIE